MTETLKIQLALSGLQSVQSGLRDIGSTVRTALSAAAGIGAAVASSRLVQGFLDINSAMAKTAAEAEKFGVSTEFLSSFQYALRLTGVEQSKLGEAMKGYVERARQQGVAIGDMSAELLKQADIFSRMPDGPAKTALAIDRFGEAGIALIPVLNRGGDGLREMADEAKRFGLVVDEDAAKAAKALKIDVERLDSVFEGLKIQITKGVIPAISDMAKASLAAISTATGKDTGIGQIIKASGIYAANEYQKLTRNITFASEGLMEAVDQVFSKDKKMSLGDIIKAASNGVDEFDAKLRKLREPIKDVQKVVDDVKAAAGAVNYLQRSMANANALLDIRSITARGDNSTDVAKRSEERAIAAQRMAELQRQQKALEATRPADMGAFQGPDGRITQTEEAIAYQERHIALMREQAVVQADLNSLGASETSRVWTQTMLDIQNQWGSWSAQIAGALATTFNTAIGSISSNLTSVIMQTKSWGQALANIGNTILTTVIQSIIEMGVRWVLTRAMVGVANILWSQKEAVAAAPKAMLESISSYGVAALLGGAAFAGIMAAVGGFSAGGYTGNIGTSTPAGIVHGQEFVMSAPAVQSIGVGTLEAMNQTGGIPASSRESRIVIVDDARSASDLANDPNFETVVVNLAAANAWRIRG